MLAINVKLAGLAFAAALATSAATLLATGAPAHAAQPTASTVSARVSHGDLNLAGATGVRKLNARVLRAAERLCIEDGIKSLKVLSAGRACVKLTVANAQPQVRQAIARQAVIRLAAADVQ